MKNRPKKIAAVLLAAGLLNLTAFAQGEYLMTDSFDDSGLSANWTVKAGTAQTADSCLSAIAAKTSPAGRVDSKTLNLGNKFAGYARLKTNFSLLASQEIWISDGTRILKPVTIQNLTLTPFEDAAYQVRLEHDTFYDLVFVVDAVEKTGKLLQNGAEIYSCAIEIPAGMDFENAHISIRNASRREFSDFSIDTFSLVNEQTLRPVSQPANGASMVDVAALEKVRLDYGTLVLPPEQAAVQLFEQDIAGGEKQRVEAAVQPDATGFSIVPQGGFAAQKRYILETVSVQNVFGAVLPGQQVSFTTAQSGYVLPRVEVNVTPKQIVEGDRVSFAVSVTQGSGATASVAVKAPDGTKKTLTAVSEGAYQYVIDAARPAGRQSYLVTVKDVNGGEAKQTVDLDVMKNEDSVISFSVAEGETINLPQQVTVTAEDTYGIADITLYLGEDKIGNVQQSPAVFTINTAAQYGDMALRAVATDGKGKTTVKTISVQVASKQVSETFTYDFESYTGGVPDGFQVITTDGGFAQAKTEAPPHGNVFRFGKNAASEPKYGLYFAHNTQGMTPQALSVIAAEFDMKIEANGANFVTEFKGSGTSAEDIRFKAADLKIVLKDSGNTTREVDYKTDYWHRVKVEIDEADSTYSFWLDGVQYADHYKTTTEIKDITQIRWMYKWGKGADASVLIDNYKAYGYYGNPTIQQVLYQGQAVEKLPYGAQAFALKLSGGKSAAEAVTPENITLTDDMGNRIGIKTAAWDANNTSIEVTLAQPLSSSVKYQIILADAIAETAMSKFVATASRDFDVTGYRFLLNQSPFQGTRPQAGDKAAVQMNVQSLAETKNATIILTIWQNGTIQSLTLATAQIKAGETAELVTPELTIPGGDVEIRAYAWEDFESLASVTDRIYTYR